MEGICDMFQDEKEGDQQWCLKPINVNIGDREELTIYQIDNKEESVLIGQAIWQASYIMANWVYRKKEMFEGKNVLEIGSGIGLSGLACAIAGAN